MKSKNIIAILTFIVIMPLFINSCGKQEAPKAKSMEEIRATEGVPVRLITIGTNEFDKDLTFFAKLSGIKETAVHSMISDRIVKLNAKMGSSVGAGKVVVEFPKDNPAIQYDQAKLGYENAKKLYDRMKNLLAAGETSQQNFDNAETQYLVSKRNWESVKQMIMVEAPFAGTIVSLPKNEGEKVTPDDELFTVAQLNKMVAKVWATSSEIMHLRTGMPATMKIDGREYIGKISEIALAIDPMKQAFGVEIQFNNAKRELKSGLTTEIKIQAYRNEKALMVPRSYIIKDGDNKYIFIENNGKAERRAVETGIESGINVEIRGGLKQGERLITEGLSLLRDGSKVKVIQ